MRGWKSGGASLSAIVEDEIDGLRIAITPAPEREWLFIYVISAGVFLFGFLYKLIENPSLGIGPRWAPVVRMGCGIAYILGCVVLAAHYLWQFRACDIVQVNGRSLRLRRVLGPFRQSLDFDLADVGELRFDPLVPRAIRMYHPHDLGIGGTIAFDCAGKTSRLGMGLSRDDPGRIIALIESRGMHARNGPSRTT